MSVSSNHRSGARRRRRTLSPRCLAPLGAALLLTGCGGAPPREAVVVTDSAGITIVDNDEAQGAWTLDSAWRLAQSPAVQIGNVPLDQTQQLYRVRHSIRLRDGSIAVANTGLADVRVYDASGVHLNTLGMPPDEKQEPMRPILLHELPGDSLLVVLMDLTVAVYDSAGSMARRSGPLSTDVASDPRPTVAGRFGNGTVLMKVYLPGDTTAGEVERTRVRLLTFGTNASPLGSLGDFEDLTVLRGEGLYVFGPEGVEATGDSTLWYGPGDRFELREVALDGSTRRIVRLNRLAGEVTQVDRTAYEHSAVGELEDSLDEAAAQAVVANFRYAERFPAYAQIVVDDGGNLWVRAYQWFGMGQPQKWTVFDRDGRFLGDLTMPTLMEVHHIGADFVLGRMADYRGKEAIYFYPLIKP
ncbi:MAG: hypothetical protein ACYC6F_03430 [Longimicrobiales bacterium]